MERTIHEQVVVQPGGRIVVEAPGLPEGVTADVIISFEEERLAKSYTRLFGTGHGGFATADEADVHLRKERDVWD